MSSDAEQPRIILPDGGPDSQELDHERRKGSNRLIMLCALLLLSHGTSAPLLENFLFHISPFKENSVKPIAFLANLKIIVSVSAIARNLKEIPSN